MKVGDLIRSRRRGWLGLVLEYNKRNNSITLAWIDNGEIDSCSAALMEVISEHR